MSNDKKMVFFKWWPDDVLNGCSLLTWQSELTYRRIMDNIYISDNNLFDDEITWQVLTSKFNGNVEQIKDELIKKKKIYIENGLIQNRGCNKYLSEAKLNNKTASDKGKKGANARWNSPSNAQAMPTTNYKPLATSQVSIKENLFKEFWDIIRYKKGKEGTWNSFKKIDFDKEKFTHTELANVYNEQLDNLPDWQSPKHVQGWLSEKRWNDEESYTATEFAKRYNIEGTFMKYEDNLYYFQEKDSFGLMTYKYNKSGKLVTSGKKI